MRQKQFSACSHKIYVSWTLLDVGIYHQSQSGFDNAILDGFGFDYSLTSAVVRLAAVVTVEELAVEQLYGNDSENEMEQYVYYQYVYHVLQRIDDAIENRFELGHPFNGLKRTQHSQHSQRFDCRQIRTDGSAAETNILSLHTIHARRIRRKRDWGKRQRHVYVAAVRFNGNLLV